MQPMWVAGKMHLRTAGRLSIYTESARFDYRGSIQVVLMVRQGANMEPLGLPLFISGRAFGCMVLGSLRRIKRVARRISTGGLTPLILSLHPQTWGGRPHTRISNPCTDSACVVCYAEERLIIPTLFVQFAKLDKKSGALLFKRCLFDGCSWRGEFQLIILIRNAGVRHSSIDRRP